MTARTHDDSGRETSQSADRAAAVLYAVAQAGPLRPADLARRTGIERRALSRLLTSLERAGLLRRAERDGAYDLGAGLVTLGRLAGERNVLARVAQPVLRRLLQDVRATVILHQRLGDHLSPQAILYPPGELAIRYPEGRRIALWEGVGRAVLAALSERDIAEIVDLKTRPELRQAIEETRRVGVAVSHGEVIAGITALGAAVLDAAGSPIAVVVVVAPRDAEPEQHATALRDAAAELTALLSYQPTPRPGTPAPN